MQTWVYIGYFNQWIRSSIPTSRIYQLNDAAPTLALSDYLPSEKYTKQQQCFSVLNLFSGSVRADEVDVDGTVEEDLGKSREGSRTDDEVVQRFVFI